MFYAEQPLSVLCSPGMTFAHSVHMVGTPTAALAFPALGRIWPCKD